MFHLFGSLAEFERELVRERTRAGLEAVRARGRNPGRPPKPGPKDIEGAKSMLANPALESEDVCRHLGVTRSTLYRHPRAAGDEELHPWRRPHSRVGRPSAAANALHIAKEPGYVLDVISR